jgi:hypothetical protein
VVQLNSRSSVVGSGYTGRVVTTWYAKFMTGMVCRMYTRREGEPGLGHSTQLWLKAAKAYMCTASVELLCGGSSSGGGTR